MTLEQRIMFLNRHLRDQDLEFRDILRDVLFRVRVEVKGIELFDKTILYLTMHAKGEASCSVPYDYGAILIPRLQYWLRSYYKKWINLDCTLRVDFEPFEVVWVQQRKKKF